MLCVGKILDKLKFQPPRSLFKQNPKQRKERNPSDPLLLQLLQMHSPSPSGETSADTIPIQEPSNDEFQFDLPPLIHVYKSGRVERLCGTTILPSFDPSTNVLSKNALIDPNSNLSARLYLPSTTSPAKLPILIYFHGGAFLIESAFSPTYHPHLNNLASLAHLLAVSVNYRLAPENPLPAAYDDAWTALRWVLSAADPWVTDRGDLDRVYIAGDSAGANIAHNMAVRAGSEGMMKGKIKGMALVHPFFGGEEAVGREESDKGFRRGVEGIWRFVCPGTKGADDRRINPVGEEAAGLEGLGCGRVMVVVVGRDVLWSRGKMFYERLKESGWKGEIEMVDGEEDGHVFHILEPATERAMELTRKFFV